jgi:hypothetical protein
MILLADFTNSTGDPVFASALKQALTVQLQQSPFLNVFPGERARETLKYMGRSPDERVAGPDDREICERNGIKAMIAGEISQPGSQYVLTGIPDFALRLAHPNASLCHPCHSELLADQRIPILIAAFCRLAVFASPVK